MCEAKLGLSANVWAEVAGLFMVVLDFVNAFGFVPLHVLKPAMRINVSINMLLGIAACYPVNLPQQFRLLQAQHGYQFVSHWKCRRESQSMRVRVADSVSVGTLASNEGGYATGSRACFFAIWTD